LSGEEQAVLAARARSVRSEHRDRLRAAIVLAAAAGRANAAIARELGVCAGTVRKWRSRFAASRSRSHSLTRWPAGIFSSARSLPGSSAATAAAALPCSRPVALARTAVTGGPARRLQAMAPAAFAAAL
jgi:transposase-like protein